MRAKVKLALQQSKMRASQQPKRRRRLQKTDIVDAYSRIRPMAAALFLAYVNGYSATDLARRFNWPRDLVAAWLEAGKLLT